MARSGNQESDPEVIEQMAYSEAHGASLKKSRELERAKHLHHLRIYAHEEGSSKSPRWLVEHHSKEQDENPAQHDFSDGSEMLAHIANHASVPEEGEGQ